MKPRLWVVAGSSVVEAPYQKEGTLMRRARVVLVAAIALALVVLASVGSPTPAEARVSGVLDANCSGTYDFNSGFAGEFRAQTFTAVHTGKLTDARVKLARFSDAGGRGVRVQIRTLDSSGAPSSTVLASTIIPRSSIGSDPFALSYRSATAHFERAAAARVRAGRSYALVMWARSGYYIAGTSRDCPGSFYVAPRSGTPFTEVTGGLGADLLFRVYVVPR
jgi:hypothetical protein